MLVRLVTGLQTLGENDAPSPEGMSESSPGRSPGWTMEQTRQSRQGRLKAVYEIQPSLAGLIFIVEADPALRAGLFSDALRD
jgi:hypothetical protein